MTMLTMMSEQIQVTDCMTSNNKTAVISHLKISDLNCRAVCETRTQEQMNMLESVADCYNDVDMRDRRYYQE